MRLFLEYIVENYLQNSIESFIEVYQDKMDSFGPYLLGKCRKTFKINSNKCLISVYFLAVQFYSIFYFYQSLRSLLAGNYTLPLVISMVYKANQVTAHLINIFCLTDTVNSTFEKIVLEKIKLQKQLKTCKDKDEKQHLKYLLERLNMLKPMSACGFFEINRSTLSSMLSIR